MELQFGGMKYTLVHEIDYLFQKAFWDNGYTTETSIVCKNYALEMLCIDEVYSIIRDSDVASQIVNQVL